MAWLKQKNLVLVAAATLIIGAGVLTPVHFAEAGIFGWAFGGLFDGLAAFLGFIITLATKFFGLFVNWFGDLLNWVFQIQTFTRVPAVQTGWTIARDLANMFFILVLLLIGFATIVRYESYGIKKLLPRLIIVALLMNFSLLLAGVVIDIGNDLGLFFVRGGNPNQAIDIGANAMAAIGVSRTTVADPALQTDIEDKETDGGLDLLLNAIMRLIVTIVVAFLFAAMGLIMVFRMVYLWILLIFLPLALVASIVPAGMGIWKKWTTNFLKWAFFPAIFGLFLYIGLLVGYQFNKETINAAFGGAPSLTDDSGILGYSLIQLLQYIVVIFILFFGLVQANNLGLAGAQGALNIATKARGKALDWAKRGALYGPRKGKEYAGRKAKQAAGGLATRALYGIDKETGERTRLRAGTEWLAKGKFRSQLLRPAARVMQDRADAIKKQEKDFAKFDPRRLELRRASLDADGRVAADRALAAKSLFKPGKVISKENIASSQRHAASLGLEKELLVANPHIAKEFNVINNSAEQTAEKIKKIFESIKPEDFIKVNGQAPDAEEKGISDSERSAREFVRDTILEGFTEAGNLHAGHITNAAYKNPKLHQVISREVKATDSKGAERVFIAGRRGTVERRKYKDSVRKSVIEGVSGILTPEEAVKEEEETKEEKKT